MSLQRCGRKNVPSIGISWGGFLFFVIIVVFLMGVSFRKLWKRTRRSRSNVGKWQHV